jgi:hypothetical protein
LVYCHQNFRQQQTRLSSMVFYRNTCTHVKYSAYGQPRRTRNTIIIVTKCSDQSAQRTVLSLWGRNFLEELVAERKRSPSKKCACCKNRKPASTNGSLSIARASGLVPWTGCGVTFSFKYTKYSNL